jgi:hypothetical protein
VEYDELIKYSPPLADVRAIKWANNLDAVITELLRRLRPEASPLIIARDFLIKKGVTPPIVTDEWWLDVVEFKEGDLRYPDPNVGHRWIFPLPHEAPDRGLERGLNIAWTALQLDWMREATEGKYCQLTHPERIHSYLKRCPGLLDCCRANPSIAALYAPQLTIPGYDDGLADVFDEALQAPYENSLHFFGYSGPDTVNGDEPLCGEAMAWRHPTFGNYTQAELASAFASAHTYHYTRSIHDGMTCLIWLLTDAASWLPDRIRWNLLDGMRSNTYTWAPATHNWSADNAFSHALAGTKSKFRFSRRVKADLQAMVGTALGELGVAESAGTISRRFIERDFVGGYYDQQDKLREIRRRQ